MGPANGVAASVASGGLWLFAPPQSSILSAGVLWGFLDDRRPWRAALLGAKWLMIRWDWRRCLGRGATTTTDDDDTSIVKSLPVAPHLATRRRRLPCSQIQGAPPGGQSLRHLGWCWSARRIAGSSARTGGRAGGRETATGDWGRRRASVLSP